MRCSKCHKEIKDSEGDMCQNCRHKRISLIKKIGGVVIAVGSLVISIALKKKKKK